jgi:hypothetical protein
LAERCGLLPAVRARDSLSAADALCREYKEPTQLQTIIAVKQTINCLGNSSCVQLSARTHLFYLFAVGISFACLSCLAPSRHQRLRDLRGRGGQAVPGPLFSRVRAPRVAHSDISIVGSEFASPGRIIRLDVVSNCCLSRILAGLPSRFSRQGPSSAGRASSRRQERAPAIDNLC